MKNGVIWQDIDGNDIQAHGGCIIEFEGTYYWYGENKGADNCPGTRRVDVIGVSCYSSKNLHDWKYEGLVLASDKEDEASPLYYKKVLERPKVIYNEKTGKFVLWAHADSADYVFGGVIIAVSDSPVGPFELLCAKQPNKQDSRDMTLFKDIDGTAYLVHSKDWNMTMNVSRLTDDYTDVDGFYASVLIDQEREAPALFYKDGTYYMISSGCTGWRPNQALYARSGHVIGKWKLIDNPCRGEKMDTTFDGQSAYIFEVKGDFYLMLDHWHPYDLKSSGYSILKIDLVEHNGLRVNWQEEWKGI